MSDKPTLPRAYSVQSDEGGAVVFALSNVVARRDGATILNVEFNEVSCRLIPGADKYLWMGEVPRKALVEEFGWYQECGWCSRHVDEDDRHRIWHGDGLYCDGECLARRINLDMDYAQQEREKQKVRLEAVELAKAKFPGATDFTAFEAYRRGVVVGFRYPGGRFPAHWTVGEDVASVSHDEKEAFERYINSIRGGDK